MAYDMTHFSTAPDGSVDRIKKAKKRSTKLFGDFSQYRTYCQALAEIFWPERASFTTTRTIGIDMQDGLFTGTPQTLRRDFANRIGSVIRAPTQDWFKLVVRPDEVMDNDAAREWCDQATRTQRNIIYDRRTNFARTMALGDHDFVTFGNAVSWCAYSKDGSHLVFRPVHLRDCAWSVNEYGDVDELYQRIKEPLDQVARLFSKDNLPKCWRDKLDKPETEMEKVTYVRGVYPIWPDVIKYAAGNYARFLMRHGEGPEDAAELARLRADFGDDVGMPKEAPADVHGEQSSD